jgi:general stress protein YciG
MEHQAQRTRNSGFASMERTKQKEIARKGGMAAHRKGTAHEFTTDEARAAGRKGGESVSSNRSHMAMIGRLGGKRSAERRRLNAMNNVAGAGDSSAESSESIESSESMETTATEQGAMAGPTSRQHPGLEREPEYTGAGRDSHDLHSDPESRAQSREHGQ